MKIILMILLFIAFIGPSVEDNKSITQVFKDSVVNYVSSVDNTVTYLSENSEVFRDITQSKIQNSYDNVMQNRVLVKHVINSGESLDSIIRFYNDEVKNIDEFRTVILNENPDSVSSDYSLKAGNSILVPSDINRTTQL
ncbi:MAG: hypothetical protein R3Y64_04455 [Peptostreptococcaceae bacterium]